MACGHARWMKLRDEKGRAVALECRSCGERIARADDGPELKWKLLRPGTPRKLRYGDAIDKYTPEAFHGRGFGKSPRRKEDPDRNE